MSMSADDADLLHRLRDGDVLAPSQFCERFLPQLLSNRGWAAGLSRDEHLVKDAAIEALFTFVRSPHSYDPARMEILPYLRLAAKRDLLNALARERRHAIRRAPLEAVELHPVAGNDEQEGPELPGGASAEELLQRLRTELPDPRDWEAMCLIMDGVRTYKEFVRVYGLSDLRLAEQRRVIKQHKDRLKKRAMRLGIRFPDD
jgi:DNA-directed RNA polymerase specialized sigma24 family protein